MGKEGGGEGARGDPAVVGVVAAVVDVETGRGRRRRRVDHEGSEGHG